MYHGRAQYTKVALVALLALGVAEPPRCGAPIPTVAVSEIPPAIVIVQGKTTQRFLSFHPGSTARLLFLERIAETLKRGKDPTKGLAPKAAD